MRTWHFALVRYLPRQQLVSQWRDCVCMAKSICEKGTPNHILVNKIMDYPIEEFCDYCNIVLVEMVRRGYKVSESSINKLEDYIGFSVDSEKQNSHPFAGWHNKEYAQICYWNLKEKYLCGGVSEKEWNVFSTGYGAYISCEV